MLTMCMLMCLFGCSWLRKKMYSINQTKTNRYTHHHWHVWGLHFKMISSHKCNSTDLRWTYCAFKRLFISPQHQYEGAKGTAPSAQLQGSQLPQSQREIRGIPLFYSNFIHTTTIKSNLSTLTKTILTKRNVLVTYRSERMVVALCFVGSGGEERASGLWKVS